MGQHSMGQTPTTAVGAQAALLMDRLIDLERRLYVQEWWMLGSTIAAAKVLAEVASLIPVARAELDQCLVQFCGSAPAESPAPPDGALAPDLRDSAQVAAHRASATELLRTMGEALPPTTNYARQLRAYAQRVGFPSTGVDVLAIVADRLADAQEAVQSVVM